MTFFRRLIPLAAILAVATALVGQGTAVTVAGSNSDGLEVPNATSINLPGSIAAGTSLDSNGDLTVSDDILAGGDIEGANLTGTNTGNVTIATGAAQDIWTIGGANGQVLDVRPFDANTFLAGPESGSAAKPEPRALVDADIPGGIARDSEIPSAARGAISVSEPLDYDSGTGAISIMAAGLASDGYITAAEYSNAFGDKAENLVYASRASGTGTGTPTFRALEDEDIPEHIARANVVVSSVTPRDPNTILAGPSSGSAAAPAFRALVADDIPTYLNLNGITGPLQIAGTVGAYDGMVTVNEITANDGTIELTGGINATGALYSETTVTALGAITGKVQVIPPPGASSLGFGECTIIGAETMTLPAAAAGLHVYIVSDNASSVVSAASGDSIDINAQSGHVIAKELNPSNAGSGIQLIAIDAERWIAIGDYPTWNAEPVD